MPGEISVAFDNMEITRERLEEGKPLLMVDRIANEEAINTDGVDGPAEGRAPENATSGGGYIRSAVRAAAEILGIVHTAPANSEHEPAADGGIVIGIEAAKKKAGNNPAPNPPIFRLHEILATWGFRYDRFTQTCEIREPPSESWIENTDDHYHEILRHAAREKKTSFSKELVIDAVNYLCRKSPYDSLQDYLNGLQWDGEPRLVPFPC